MSSKLEFAPNASPTSSIDPEAAWRQVLARDSSATFFYAVTTTGVFLPAGLRQPPPVQDQRALLSLGGGGAGRWVSPLQALPSHHCVERTFG